MDVNNQLLKELLHKTDIAFEALRARSRKLRAHRHGRGGPPHQA